MTQPGHESLDFYDIKIFSMINHNNIIEVKSDSLQALLGDINIKVKPVLNGHWGPMGHNYWFLKVRVDQIIKTKS